MTVRAAVHVHSDWSYDGSWSLEALAREFGRRGYGAVLMAEHDRGFDDDRWRAYRQECAAASASGALLVPGIEYSDRANLVHVAIWGDLPFLGEGRPTAELLADAVAEGGAAMFAHPERRQAWRLLEEIAVSDLVGIEVWNRKYDGWAPGRRGSELCEGHAGVAPFFGLDFHTRRQFHPMGMLIDVVGAQSPASMVEALCAGRCRPFAYGIDGMRLMRGPGYSLSRSAEASRRLLRPGVRRWRRFRGRERS
jgi:hypothetical protein